MKNLPVALFSALLLLTGAVRCVAVGSLSDPSRFVSLVVTQAGFQSVTAERLATLLGADLAEVRGAIAGGQFQLSTVEEPVGYLSGPGGSEIQFCGEVPRDNYSDAGYYVLRLGANPFPAALDGQLPAAVPATYSQAELAQEKDALPLLTLTSDPEADYWMWQRVAAGVPLFDAASFKFVLKNVVPGQPGQVKARVWGGIVGSHLTTVSFNGTVLGQGNWAGKVPAEFTFTVPAAALKEGTNQLSFKGLLPPGTANSIWYVDSFAVNYPRRHLADQGDLEFLSGNNTVVTVDGFSGADVTVVDITDPKRPAPVNRVNIEPNAGGFRASFVPPHQPGRYRAFRAGALPGVASLRLGQSAGLSAPTNRAACVIIAPSALAAPARQLADYRNGQGLETRVIQLQDVFDEFGAGRPAPHAIRGFLQTALATWALKPRYAVLVGDGTYDYRDLQGKHDNLMPSLSLGTPDGIFSSDSAYADVNGDGIPDVAVGRLSCHTEAGLQAIIDKIKAYEAQSIPSRPESLLVVDHEDAAGDFQGAIDDVAAVLADKFTNHILVADAQPDPAAFRQELQAWLNSGVEAFNYAGHGALDRLGKDGYLVSGDAAGLLNGGRLPVMVVSTCLAGQFSTPGVDCLGEQMVGAPSGGVIAMIGPSGFSYEIDASLLNLRVMEGLRANNRARLGDLFRVAQAEYSAHEAILTSPFLYNILGDPALLFRVAPDAPAPNVAPYVVLTASDTSALWEPATLTLRPGASDEDGFVLSVAFYLDGVKIGESSQWPFELTVENVAEGEHQFVARAIDDAGAVAGSAPLVVNVGPPVRLSAAVTAPGVLSLAWSGGKAPFVVESKAALGSDTPWQAVSGALTTRSFELPADAQAMFFRVRSAP